FGADVYANSHTVVSEEYSAEYHEGAEPYYPVNDARNDALAAAYRERAEREPDVVFGGRLAQYRYYDMAPVIAEAMHRFAALHPEGRTADV
ncbi:MAG: UDP-galactopyranose mutase, partial [Alloprevotella sp.]|nr:UDP-galactopyranose mutase [Alloprevotella sp.]